MSKRGRKTKYTERQFKAKFGYSRKRAKALRSTVQARKYRAGYYWIVPKE